MSLIRKWFQRVGGIPALIRAAGLAAIVLVLFAAALPGRGRLIDPWAVRVSLLLVPAFLAAGAWSFKRTKPAADEEPGAGGVGIAWLLFAALIAYLVSNASTDKWFYFLRWLRPGGDALPFLKYGWALFCVLTAVGTLAFLPRLRESWVGLLILGILLYSVFLGARGLWGVTAGLPVYRDDHPSFMYRLWAFGQTFPRLVYYDPFWNGGRVMSYAVTSGTASIGSVLLPLWKLVGIERAYTPGLILAFLVVVPLAAAWAVRIVGGGWTGAAAGGVLALGVSQFEFLWRMHFGTVGAGFALPMILLVAACLYRVLWLGRMETRTGVVLVLASVLLLSWPAAAVMVAPLGLGILFSARQWTKPKIVFLAVCAAAIGVLCIPYAAGVVLHSGAAKLARQDAPGAFIWSEFWTHGWSNFGDHLRQGNPVLMIFGLAGLWFLPRRGLKLFLGPALIVLALMAGWGESWKPQLQLTRAGIPLFLLAILPASLWIEQVLETRSPWMAPLRSAAAVLLLLTGLNMARLYRNKGAAPYETMSPEMQEITAWIRETVPENGRLLFAGRTVHGFGRGHVAVLPALAGRQMMACDFYHFSMKSVEYEYPPSEWRQEEEDVFEFMQTYNVTHILTYHDHWKEFFRGRPAQFEELTSFGDSKKRTAFRVIREPGFFLKGSGVVHVGVNRITVHVDNPDEDAVLKFNWVDDLSAPAPIELYPVEAKHGVRLLGIKPNGDFDFEIRYRKWL